MIYFLHFTLFALGCYLSFYVIYTLGIVLIHFFLKGKDQPLCEPRTRFAVIIPAHNEELLVERLLRSLASQDYPSSMVKVIVVADNCTDNTPAIALSYHVSVLIRSDLQLRGKGYAIKYGIEKIDYSEFGAIFVVDADSIVELGTLRALDQAIQQGARIIQCYNGVANPDKSWFTRLMAISRTFGNEVLGPAKETVGLSAHLMGNGMCFTRDVILKYGWDAFTVGEDWEYYAKVVLQGERIAFVNQARVYHQESVGLKQATSQRLRWSSGRFAVAAKYGFRMLFNGLIRGRLLLVDAALPLVFPNPSLGISLTVLLLLIGLMTPFLAYQKLFTIWFMLLSFFQLGFFLTGVLYTKDKKKNLLAILFAPIFLIWKSALDLLAVAGIGRKYWVRTERKL